MLKTVRKRNVLQGSNVHKCTTDKSCIKTVSFKMNELILRLLRSTHLPLLSRGLMLTQQKGNCARIVRITSLFRKIDSASVPRIPMIFASSGVASRSISHSSRDLQFLWVLYLSSLLAHLYYKALLSTSS